jgi:hypothetical protein
MSRERNKLGRDGRKCRCFVFSDPHFHLKLDVRNMNLDDLSILPQTETARGVHDREFIIFINKIKMEQK